jgi:flagellar basal body-associated protein FliL
VVPRMDGIVTIVIVVLIVLFVLGYFGRGRFRV